MDCSLGEPTWPLLRTFHDARPDLELTVMRARIWEAASKLQSGVYDVLLGIGPFDPSQCRVTEVTSTPLSAVVPAHHPLAEANVIEAAWLADRLTICPPEGMGRVWVAFWAA
jgi:DNA-binding transcriptional LysR family regulator